MLDVTQELMTPHEAARWFRRSPSWLRQQRDLLRVGGPGGQPLYHVQVCRAYVLGRLCGLDPHALHETQIKALAAACGLAEDATWRTEPPQPPANTTRPARADTRQPRTNLPNERGPRSPTPQAPCPPASPAQTGFNRSAAR